MTDFVQREPEIAAVLYRPYGRHLIQGRIVGSAKVVRGGDTFQLYVFVLGEGIFDGMEADSGGNAYLWIKTPTGKLRRLFELYNLNQVSVGSYGALQWRFAPGFIGQPADYMWPVSESGVGYSGMATLTVMVKTNANTEGDNEVFEL